MYCWLLTRTEVLMMVNGEDALLMVNKNWGIDDANGDDALLIFNKYWGIVEC